MKEDADEGDAVGGGGGGGGDFVCWLVNDGIQISSGGSVFNGMWFVLQILEAF